MFGWVGSNQACRVILSGARGSGRSGSGHAGFDLVRAFWVVTGRVGSNCLRLYVGEDRGQVEFFTKIAFGSGYRNKLEERVVPDTISNRCGPASASFYQTSSAMTFPCCGRPR